ncbi:hypothetical protein HY643_01575 [Candidatus Woesearchaeota archaeon]|nr:hypothetical protein [Candidatus Woesearchaeota archaeon]
MPIKFLLDEHQRKSEEELKRIIEIVGRKPYPDRNTVVLARFVNAMFGAAQKLGPTKKFEQKIVLPKQLPQLVPTIIKAVPQFEKPLPPPPRPHKKVGEPEAPEPPKISETPKPAVAEEAKPKIVAVGNLPKEGEKYVLTIFDTEIKVSLEKNERTGKIEHKVVEPEINFRIMEEMRGMLKKDFEKNIGVLDKKDVLMDALKKACKKTKIELKPEYLNVAQYYLKRDWIGFRNIDALMRDEKVREIYCDGVNKPIKVVYGEGEKIDTNTVFEDNDEVNLLIEKFAELANLNVSQTSPILNIKHEGLKIQATMGFGGVSSKFIIIKEEQ